MGGTAELGGRDGGTEIVFELPASLGAEALPAPVLAAVESRDTGRVRLVTESPITVLHALSGWALEEGYEVADLTVGRRSLEDTYLELTETA